MEKMIGKWTFIIGVLVAIVAGFFSSVIPANIVSIVLIIAGLIIGLLNVTGEEVTQFLIAAIALLAVGAAGLGSIAMIGASIEAILKNIVAIVAPAALVVALKAVYSVGQISSKR